jgi:hypothetical protein
VFSNLDRIQIIKGWIDDAGERQKRVYDVAVLGGYPSAAGESVTRRLRKFYATPWKPWTLVETLDRKKGRRFKKA